MDNKKECLVPDCSETATIRGLCKRHYNMAYQLVLTKKTTWEELHKAGRIIIIRETKSYNINIKDRNWLLDKTDK